MTPAGNPSSRTAVDSARRKRGVIAAKSARGKKSSFPGLLRPAKHGAPNCFLRIARSARFEATRLFLCDMDSHLVDRVIEISAWIPDGLGGLNASLAVRCTGFDRVVSAICIPGVAPQAPCVFRFLRSERCRIPGRAIVGRNLDFHNVGFTGPRGAVRGESAGFHAAAIKRS